LAEHEPAAGGDTTRQIRVALRLFDWVIRNIQQQPDATAADTASLEQPFPDGSESVSWEALLIGRGHAWVRARVFILLARQQRLNVVMLGIEADSSEQNAEPTPWSTALLLDGRLYLLDTRLGLPIPGADGQGVATLAELIAEPALLRQLDVEGGPKYPVDKQDLSRVVAMLDATPDYLSQRMKLVESRLTGANKTVLTIQPSRLRQPLREIKGITRVMLWPLPYDALRYQRAILRNQHAKQRRAELFSPFEGDAPLGLGRRQHFRGVFQSDPPEIGAKAHYLKCRIPDSEFGKTAAEHTAAALRQAGSPEDAEIDESQIRALQQKAQSNLARAKQSASYWLGLMAFEEGKYQVAIDFLDSRTLQAFPDGSWSQGAHYNLGRAYERIAQDSGKREDWEKAREQYLADKDTPQYAGNWLRARRIEQRLSSEENRKAG
jgi:tetratricopeptide (TPR) repeat protein